VLGGAFGHHPDCVALVAAAVDLGVAVEQFAPLELFAPRSPRCDSGGRQFHSRAAQGLPRRSAGRRMDAGVGIVGIHPLGHSRIELLAIPAVKR